MLLIKKILIKRFRSIMDLKLDIDTNYNYITVCGENNVGKTNVLKAINLFFNPNTFNKTKDRPYTKQITGGSSKDPTIEIVFFDSEQNTTYTITRNFNIKNNKVLYETYGKNNNTKEILKNDYIDKILSKVLFFYIDSININLPNSINNTILDIYDTEYNDGNFKGLKGQIRELYNEFLTTLKNKLNNDLSKKLNKYFKKYKNEWSVNFEINNKIENFVDLITNDVEFVINDGTTKFIDCKGSGLQRLTYILLHFRIIEQLKDKKNFIIAIDEPDIYLHNKFEKQLYKDIKELCNFTQIFITTHSINFIEINRMKNIFLLEGIIGQKKYSKRKNKEYNVIETKLIKTDSTNSDTKIKDCLGISIQDYDLLSYYNIFVEGYEDKKYIENLLKFFNFEIPNIITLNGADNTIKSLEFYNSFYEKNEKKPNILILLDNDQKGREIFNKINLNNYKNLNIKKYKIINCSNDEDFLREKNISNINIEIEDFIYYEIFLYLTNKLLYGKIKQIKEKNFIKIINKKNIKRFGILSELQHYINTNNDYSNIEITNNNFKNGIVDLFERELNGNKVFINKVEECDKKYPEVRKFLEKLQDFNNF